MNKLPKTVSYYNSIIRRHCVQFELWNNIILGLLLLLCKTILRWVSSVDESYKKITRHLSN